MQCLKLLVYSLIYAVNYSQRHELHSSNLTRARLLLLASHHTLDLRNALPKNAKQLAKPKTPALDPNAPDEEVHQRPIAEAEGQEDAKVSPLVASLDVEGG